MPTPPSKMIFSKLLPSARLLTLALGFALASALSGAWAAEPDITGRYVAKDAEFVIEKIKDTDYKMQYYGKCLLSSGEPFEFFTNGKARKLKGRSFVISVTASRVPTCARFAPWMARTMCWSSRPRTPRHGASGSPMRIG
ncbi:hypothetical protein GT347_01220 [Xylophilus rhododendri]|uniref:Uncharacterized protein n=1 Tax=Xylophilus rhododendri TaxID=2697032 RepID=A0A857J0V8_9BURK|nr:hypothetical protein [Xylophilus rhododendri]QHI96731.1 hypothetical protein GT347_01220 [Xylophilus rhododendri]